jgi:hypothetical protein
MQDIRDFILDIRAARRRRMLRILAAAALCATVLAVRFIA